MYGLLSARRSRGRSTCAHTHHSFRRTPALCCRRFSSMEPSTRSGSWQMPCSVEITHIHSPQSSNTCRNIGINWVWKIRYLGVRLFVEGLLWFLATKVLGAQPIMATYHFQTSSWKKLRVQNPFFEADKFFHILSDFILTATQRAKLFQACFPTVHAHHQATKYLACNWPTRKLILEMKRNRFTGLEETLHAPSELPLHCLLI